MGKSFIDYKSKGFWAKDELLEALLFMLVRELKKFNFNEVWIENVIDQWTSNYLAGYVGCVPSNLNEFFESPERVDLLRKLLEEIIQKLEKNEDFITIEDLNNNKVGLGGWKGVNRIAFQNAAELMLDLIDGRMKTDASSPIDYWKYERRDT